MTMKLYEGDSYQILAQMAERGEQVESVVCDPPYGLLSIVKRFGKKDSKAAKYGSDGAFSRASKGFLEHTWDGTGVERDVEFWKLVNAVLLPGGYIVAFSSARTYHHMAVAIENAGFVTHPMIGWAYGSGMPKAHNPGVKGFEGWRHGGQVRKPALEPIYVGQKPYEEGSVKRNIEKYGVGAVNIEGVMIPSESGDDRWPANLITDGSDEVAALLPDSTGGNAIRFFEQYPNPFDGEPLIYNPKATRIERNGSDHATVKPIALMRSLVRHVTPPGGTVLDPFAGTGTTGVAADLEGVNSIMIEAQSSYADDIRRRFATLSPEAEAYLEAIAGEREDEHQL
jgi:site-specific DNA-methyltransferase (adenine-specific)